MRIIIVGSGVAGLSTYLFLQKNLAPLLQSKTLEIRIFESHQPCQQDTSTSTSSAAAEGEATETAKKAEELDGPTVEELSASTAWVGGALGIGPNGMRMLRDISEELRDDVRRAGFMAENFVFRSARGWRLLAVSSKDSPDGDDEQECCVSISRHVLRELLKKAAEATGATIEYRKVVEVLPADKDDDGPIIRLEDGTEENADLVIGADGVRSVVRKGIFGDAEETRPIYEGLIGVGGFIDSPPPASVRDEKSMVFTFGANGFFGYCGSDPKTMMWWSTCEAPDLPSKTRISIEEMRTRLKARHGNWKDPIIQDLIKQANVDLVFPTWIVPALPTWGKGACIVLGDAAHAMHPTSGQGSSQALEDSKCLSLILAKFLGTSGEAGGDGNMSMKDAIDLSNKAFYDVRNPRVRSIAERAIAMSGKKKEQSFLEEMIMCFFLWLLGKWVMEYSNRGLKGWPMEDLIEKEVNQLSKTKG